MAVIKSTITFPFLRWHKGKNDPIATAQAISTNSKSPKIGDKNTTLPKIENMIIRAEIKKIKPPNIAKYLEVLFKIRPKLLSGSIFKVINFFIKLIKKFYNVFSYFEIKDLAVSYSFCPSRPLLLAFLIQSWIT